MKRATAYVMLFINKLKQKQCSKVQEARLKENLFENIFGPDIKSIKKSCLNENNQQHASLQNKTLQELKPFVDENGIVCVGGRLQDSSLDFFIFLFFF